MAPPARAEGVALTFDDLPGLSLSNDTAYLKATTVRLLDGLRRRHMPAIGFVIGDRLEGDDRAARYALLRRWLDAGVPLGNHTYSHESFDRMTAQAYIADVARADAVLRPLLAARGQTPRWFRHPYLETGASAQDKAAFEAWLTAQGYRVAPVTLENADYDFALVYDDAVSRHDRKAQRQIRKAYLEYTEQAVAWYRKAALQLLGRRPDLVFLLHACRLNADTLGDLAAILRKNDLTPVSLDKAMQDPAYATPDNVVFDANGDDWLERWAATLHRDLPWDSFPDPPKAIVDANDRLDTNS
jgi:peptidoglycan/xylan/chitin deacetylase (PgdA/CDA1 family)